MNPRGHLKLFTWQWLLISLGFGVVGFLLPWWGVLIVAVISGISCWDRSQIVIAVGGAAAFAWGLAIFSHDFATGFRLSQRVGGLLGLSSGAYLYIILVGGIALTSALAALLGSSLREIIEASFRPKEGRPKG